MTPDEFQRGETVAYPTSGNPLLWREDLGYGYLKSNGFDYSESYWENYSKYRGTEMGEKLTEYRASFVEKHLPPWLSLCDVGVGSGQFVARLGCQGFDINPYAKEWLEQRGSFADPYVTKFDALSFWDVLEHIDDPTLILAQVRHVFVSIPLHQSVQSCLASKHLKPNEHIWHFTHRGFISFMDSFGFSLVEHGDGETKVGRESIRTYYFQKLDK